MPPRQAQETRQPLKLSETREANEWLPESATTSDILRSATPGGVTKDGYYGIPMLKRPLWHWHIALYFFFEGVSAGSFLMASLADLFGGGRLRKLSRAGYYVSFISLVPCPPLLIADLGAPKKFHHMLRVFKPSSPMNLGAWSLAAYSVPLQMMTLRQLADDTDLFPKPIKKMLGLIPVRLAGILGIPCAVLMVSYPGVLLSTTSTPVWSRTRLLGALFSSSSIATGAAATSLALALTGKDNAPAIRRLDKVKRLAGLFEVALLAGYLFTSGKAARPLLKGRYAWHTLLAGTSAATPLLLPAKTPVEPSEKPAGKRGKNFLPAILGSALTLAGGFALKWAITYAGRKSAEDPKAARDATRPSKAAPGWGQTSDQTSRANNERPGSAMPTRHEKDEL